MASDLQLIALLAFAFLTLVLLLQLVVVAAGVVLDERAFPQVRRPRLALAAQFATVLVLGQVAMAIG